MADGNHRELRQTDEQIDAILESLNRDAERTEFANGRRAERFSMRGPRVAVEMNDAGGVIRYTVPARNISRTGMSFLIGNFVYPGTACRVQLVSEFSRQQIVKCTVARCNYLKGSASVYDVGVKFDRPVDVAMFHRDANRIRVLIADDDPSQHRLLGHFLKARNAQVSTALNGQEAVAMASEDSYQMLLMDIEMPVSDGVTAVKELRKRGYARPIVAITAQGSDDLRARCLEAGCNEFATKPITRERLLELIDTLRTEPLVSTMVDVADMAPLIDQFVADLPTIVCAMEKAFSQNELKTIESEARKLKGQGSSYGFRTITQAAAELEQAVSKDPIDPADLRAKMNHVSSLAMAARPASQGGDTD